MFIHQYFNFTVKQAGVAVAGVSYSGTTATLFLQPYLQQTLYTATLTTGVRSADKVPLCRKRAVEFTTTANATAGLAAVSLGTQVIMLFLLKQR
jgi:hypothetical protein